MKTKNWIAALVIVLSAMLAVNTYAAPKPGKAPRMPRGVEILAKALDTVTDLNDDQKAKTKAHLDDAAAELVALREAAKSQGDQSDRKANRQKMQEILMNAKTQIETELTDVQKSTFREGVRAAREAMPKREKDGKGHKDKDAI